MINKFVRILIPFVLLFYVAGCEKEPNINNNEIPVETLQMSKGLLLCEGSWGFNDASIYRLDLNNGSLSKADNLKLGDVAQDLVIYGSKAYVTVWGSNTLEVIDTATGNAISVISLGERGPRYIAPYNGKLYITCYKPHSIIRIDTSDLATVEAICTLGDFNPEGIAIADDKIFVASSFITNSNGDPIYDNKLYIVNLATFNNATPIEVSLNPQKVIKLDSTHLIINCWGNHGATPAQTIIFDITDNSITTLSQPLTNFTIEDSIIYGYYSPENSLTASYYRIDPIANTTVNILKGCNINNPYCIAVHPENGDIYIGTKGMYGSNGDLYCYNSDGGLKWGKGVGLFPSKLIFY